MKAPTMRSAAVREVLYELDQLAGESLPGLLQVGIRFGRTLGWRESQFYGSEGKWILHTLQNSVLLRSPRTME